MDPPHPHCICAHLHFPTQICLVPPHGFPPLHDCHTFPSHSHGHMPTRTDTWMPTRMDTWMPTRMDTWMPTRTDTWMPTRTDTWMPTPSSSHLLPAHLAWVPLISPAQTHAHLHGHMPTCTDTCPLARTHAHLHGHMPTRTDAHPLMLVSPTA